MLAPRSRKPLVVSLLLAVAAGLGATGFCYHNTAPEKTEPVAKQDGVGGSALFATWPKEKPEAVLILSGQTFGHVQPCGCSRPQMGGLERRANFIDGLKKKGWLVAGADLGDVHPDRHPLGAPPITTPPKQALLKYITTMNALREMGYVAVGVGKTEYAAGLPALTSGYGLQKEQPPYVLAGNVVGKSEGKTIPRETYFPPGEGKRPLVGLAEIADFGNLAVGLVGVAGKGLADEARKLDPLLEFEDAQEWLKKAVAQLAASPQKPAINVLLFQGPPDAAKAVAKDFPQFHVILCQSEDSEPPQFPEYEGKTMILQVGHKGRYVGALGVFKTAKGIELKYQLVPLGEEYLTPAGPEAEKAHKTLRMLEEYAEEVKKQNLLAKIDPIAHPAQIQQPKYNLSYVGSEKCASCHGGEHKKWTEVPHSRAMEALEKIAKRPGLRNLDAECVICHTVGFGFKTGYENEEKTPHLKNVGCESCHGPGSGHSFAEKNETFLKLMSPWKTDPTDKLPDVATMDKLAKMDPVERGKVTIPKEQLRVINAVSNMCQKCHDVENDPHFDLYKYWPKIAHTGFKK
ncbi:MAG: multiheme c-type cytochrome [Gemmataceae bacterium]